MNLTDLLLARLSPQTPQLPALISRARIAVAFTPEAIARGVPMQVIEGISARLEDATPLFRAGYAAAAFGLGQELQLTLRPQADGYMIDLADAAHSHLLVQILLRLVVAEGQTSPDAYKRLLAALDGDEDAAQEAYFPLDFLADTRRVTIMADGKGGVDFTLVPPLPRNDPALVEVISSEGGEVLTFELPSGAWLDEDVENGFLSLQNSGVFGKDNMVPGPEPEMFITDTGALSVDGWSDDPTYLAELLWVLASGQSNSVRLSNED